MSHSVALLICQAVHYNDSQRIVAINDSDLEGGVEAVVLTPKNRRGTDSDTDFRADSRAGSPSDNVTEGERDELSAPGSGEVASHVDPAGPAAQPSAAKPASDSRRSTAFPRPSDYHGRPLSAEKLTRPWAEFLESLGPGPLRVGPDRYWEIMASRPEGKVPQQFRDLFYHRPPRGAMPSGTVSK
jgi:hypothetical protein